MYSYLPGLYHHNLARARWFVLTLALIKGKSRNLSVKAVDREDLSLGGKTSILCGAGQGQTDKEQGLKD